MKHKSKMRKLITVAVLSTCMAICSIGAFGSLNASTAYAAEVQTSSLTGIFEASTGASVTYGSKEMVTLKYNASKEVSHTGLILTGGTGATFSLKNPIDLTKGSWVGAKNANNVPIFKYAIAPAYNTRLATDGTNNNQGIDCDFKYGEGLTITLTDAQDSSKYINILVKSAHPNDDNKNTAGATIGANANGQILGSTKANTASSGYTSFEQSSQNYGVGFTGNVSEPRDLVYDYATNALYTSFGRAGRTNYLIRSFGNFDLAQNNPNGVKSYVDSDEEVDFSGKFYLTIQFGTLNTAVNDTSVVLTNIGGYDLTQETLTVEDSDYIPSLNASNVNQAKVSQNIELFAPIGANPVMVDTKILTDFTVSVNFCGKEIDSFSASDFSDGKKGYSFANAGIYTINYVVGDTVLTQTVNVIDADVDPSSLANSFTASTGASVTYGSKEMIGLSSEHTGLILTGGTGATFTLKKPINLKNSKWYGANSSENTPIVEYAIAPNMNSRAGQYNGGIDHDFQFYNYKDGETGIYFILTDAKDSSKVLTINLNAEHPADDAAASPGGSIQAWATEQVPGAYRKSKTSRAEAGFNDFTAKYDNRVGYQVGFTGNAKVPRDLVYDIQKNALYTSFKSGTADNLVRAFGNFDEPTNNPNGLTAYVSTDKEVDFSGEFYLTVKFGTLDNEVSSTSIVLTSIAGAKFIDDGVVVDRTLDIVEENANNVTKKELAFGEDFVLPTFTVSNAFINEEIPFIASYKVTKSASVIAQGSYSGGEVITEQIKQAGVGDYIVSYTTNREQTVEVNYTVYPSINISSIQNAKVFVDGVEQTSPYVAITGANVLEIQTNYGYELKNLKINDLDFDNGASLSTLLETLDENVVNASVSPIEYGINFAIPETEDYTGETPLGVSYNIENLNSVQLPTISKQGYTFLGWTFNGKKVTSIEDLKNENGEIVLANYELVGYFGEESFVISYYDGTTLLKEVHVIKGNSPLSFIPEKEGYAFDCWVDASDVSVDLTNVNTNKNVYAKWKEKVVVENQLATNPTIDATFTTPKSLTVLDFVGIAVLGVGAVIGVVAVTLIIKSKKKG